MSISSRYHINDQSSQSQPSENIEFSHVVGAPELDQEKLEFSHLIRIPIKKVTAGSQTDTEELMGMDFTFKLPAGISNAFDDPNDLIMSFTCLDELESSLKKNLETSVTILQKLDVFFQNTQRFDELSSMCTTLFQELQKQTNQQTRDFKRQYSVLKKLYASMKTFLKNSQDIPFPKELLGEIAITGKMKQMVANALVSEIYRLSQKENLKGLLETIDLNIKTIIRRFHHFLDKVDRQKRTLNVFEKNINTLSQPSLFTLSKLKKPSFWCCFGRNKIHPIPSPTQTKPTLR